MMTCETGSCKMSEKIWAITDNKKLYRLTFSKSLADLICQSQEGLRVNRVVFHIGKVLQPGEQSDSGLYAIVSKSKNIALRITMFKDLAAIMSEDGSCYIREAWISNPNIKEN
jgi:hypothetical protein